MNTIGVNGRQSLMEFRQGDSNTATYSSLSISLTQSVSFDARLDNVGHLDNGD